MARQTREHRHKKGIVRTLILPKENIGEGWSRQSLELDELTAQSDKVTSKLTLPTST